MVSFRKVESGPIDSNDRKATKMLTNRKCPYFRLPEPTDSNFLGHFTSPLLLAVTLLTGTVKSGRTHLPLARLFNVLTSWAIRRSF